MYVDGAPMIMRSEKKSATTIGTIFFGLSDAIVNRFRIEDNSMDAGRRTNVCFSRVRSKPSVMVVEL